MAQQQTREWWCATCLTSCSAAHGLSDLRSRRGSTHVVVEPGVLRLSAHTALSVERGVLCSSWGSPNGERRPHLRRTERSTFISRRRERRTVRSAFSLGDHERITGRSTFILGDRERRAGRSTFVLGTTNVERGVLRSAWGTANLERGVLRSS